jgi:hypothetical protein
MATEMNAGREQYSSGRSAARPSDGGAGGLLKHTVDEALERAKITGEKIVEEARGSVRSLLDEQFKRVGEELEVFASTVREASKRLKEQEWNAAADYTDRAASNVERLSGYLHEKHFGELLGDAGELLRSQPGVFIAGAFTAGFLIARFINSSNQTVNESSRYAARGEEVSTRTTGTEALH